MQHLSQVGNIKLWNAPYSAKPQTHIPNRKSLELLRPNFAFVKPVKLDFVRNPRMTPMTRCMVLMLMGWSGNEKPIDTTVGIIAKKIGRSVRQTHRYLQDAIEEGYLYYSRTKNRWGYYTGIKIHLNFSALKPRKVKKGRNPDMTYMADTNDNYIYKRDNTEVEQRYLDKIATIMQRNGIPPTPI